MNYLDCAVALLAQLLPDIAVSGPRDLPQPPGSLPPTLIVDAVPGGLPFSPAERRVNYALRAYGADTDAALTVCDALDAALTTADGEPFGPLLVEHTDASGAHRWWLYAAELGTPGGPAIDPGGWRVAVISMAMKWAARELALDE